ncbi:MAG: DUF2062 domain-containing protein [Nanoarchaeota archaeon]|nr:DUF2062 domain-containing protein [Nanoarchaeota archaeon]MBU1989062.1 DUF2062 domain-containing protein [Nanoarchaeota archaeon]
MHLPKYLFTSDNKKYKNKIKKHLQKFLELKTSPKSIAAGFVVGTLIAFLPTFGTDVFIALLVLVIFKNLSKFSTLFALAVWNPIVLDLLYPLEYSIGNLILGNYPVQRFQVEIYNQIFAYTIRFLLGNLILTVVATAVSYFIVYHVVRAYQKKNRK